MATPQGGATKARLNMPTILVLSGCGLSSAGDRAEISAFCAHVLELDLSHNLLQDWRQIGDIVSNIPHLDFLNLSSNPLGGSLLERRGAAGFSGVRCLVLSGTRVCWDTVLLLCGEMPRLEELFLGRNGYREVGSSGAASHTLRLLHITGNRLRDWVQVRKLGLAFPGLDTLVLADNRLDSIREPEQHLGGLFPRLRSLSLSNSGLSRWADVEKLNSFPRLEEVRLQGVPLLQSFTNAERRSLTVARLPGISLLNGSVVTECEREDAERFFIRFHAERPEEELPRRYHSLVSKYGKLEPLVEIDLRPRYRALVELHCEDRVEQLSIRLDQTVAALRKQLAAVVRLPSGGLRIYYIDKGGAFGPEEMKYGGRAVHSYSVQDGDQILVVPKAK